MVFLSAGGKLTSGNDNDTSSIGSEGVSGGGGGGVFSKSNMLSLSQFAEFWRKMCAR